MSGCLVLRIVQFIKVVLPVTNQRVHAMVVCGEASQLYLFGILDLSGVTVTPFQGYFRVGISVDKHIERAVSIQHRKKCDRRRYLAEDGLDLELDLRFCFLFDRLRSARITVNVETP